MPVVVRTREYGEQFWRAMGYQAPEERRAMAAARRERDFPDD